MALHLDLHHEITSQRTAKRRDPLKLSIYGLSGLAFCFAAFYAFQLTRTSMLKSEAAALEAESARLTPLAEAALKREEEMKSSASTSDTLIQRVENRFYWASLLDLIARNVPRTVQLTRLAGDVSPDLLRKCNLKIEGVCAGEKARDAAEELREALASQLSAQYKQVTATFKSLEDSKDTARLDGRTLPTVTFSIEVQLQAREDAPPPPPKRERPPAPAAA